MKFNKQEFYRAHLARDIRFDGKFFVAVKTTKIYCRPICPARKAKLENLEFFLYAACAEEAGFRPCLRCRPETAPGSAAWVGTSDTVRRAIILMESNDLDLLTISGLANKLNVSERWLRELFKREIGLNPLRLLLDKKLSVARNLLEHSNLKVTDIAFASGFNSVRRFNDAFKSRFGNPPRELKAKSETSNIQCIHLRYRPPLNWHKLICFFKERAIPTIEYVDDNSYERLFNHKDYQGWMKVSLLESFQIKVDFTLNKTANLLEFVSRVKSMFDLDADPMLIEHDLAHNSRLKALLKNHSGIRVPGCWDGFEVAVRAIVGQRISVKAAQTILARLVNLCGEKQTFDKSIRLTHFFPSPDNMLKADLSSAGLTRTKIQSLKLLSQAILDDELALDGTGDYESTCKTLLSIKGIGPWTVEYIAMRALRNPDVFPEADLEIKKRLNKYKLQPEKWRPWRAYGAMLLLSLD